MGVTILVVLKEYLLAEGEKRKVEIKRERTTSLKMTAVKIPK